MDGAKRSIPFAFDRYVISLYPTGEILPCSNRYWIVYGNVYDKKIDDIWYSSEARDYFTFLIGEDFKRQYLK